MHELVFLETFLLAKVLELPLVTDRGQEPFPAANILLTITAHLETLLVILQTHVGAKLFDVTTESGRNYISWWRKTEIETKGAEDNMNKNKLFVWKCTVATYRVRYSERIYDCYRNTTLYLGCLLMSDCSFLCWNQESFVLYPILLKYKIW